MSWVPAPTHAGATQAVQAQSLRQNQTPILIGSRREVDVSQQVSAQTLPAQQWQTLQTYQPPQPQPPQPYIGGLGTPGGYRTTLHSTPQTSVRAVENMYGYQGVGNCSPKQQPHIARISSVGVQSAYPPAGTRRQVNQVMTGHPAPVIGAPLGQEPFQQAMQNNQKLANEAMEKIMSIGRADGIEGISSVGGSPVHHPHGSPMHQPQPVRSPHGVEGISSVGGTPFISKPGGGMIDGIASIGGTPVQPVGDIGLVQPTGQPSYVPPPVIATSRAASPPSHPHVTAARDVSNPLHRPDLTPILTNLGVIDRGTFGSQGLQERTPVDRLGGSMTNFNGIDIGNMHAFRTPERHTEAMSPKPEVRTSRLVTPSTMMARNDVDAAMTERTKAFAGDKPTAAVSSSAVARSSSCEGRAASPTPGFPLPGSGEWPVKVNCYYQNGKHMDPENPGRVQRTYGGGQLSTLKRLWKDTLGVYHVGIEVNGLEYTFGAYRAPNSKQIGNESSGVYCHHARKPGPTYDYKESAELGKTKCTLEEIERIGAELGATGFTKGQYNLVHHNCHDFCKTLAAKLNVAEVPWQYTRAATLAKLVGYGGQAPVQRNPEEEGTAVEPQPHEFATSSQIPMEHHGEGLMAR